MEDNMAKQNSVKRVEDSGSKTKKGMNVDEKREKRVITSGDTVDLVVGWDDSGDKLFFDAEDFLELEEKVVEKLSYENKRDYFIALGEHRRLERLEASEGKGKVEVIGPVKDVLKRRMKKYNKDPKMHSSMQRVEDVDHMKELGYKVVSKNEGGSNVIKNRRGEDDLVEMVIPDKRYKEHMAAVGEKSRDRALLHKEETKENINRLYKDKGKSRSKGYTIDESGASY
jgi:hypothetical protein